MILSRHKETAGSDGAERNSVVGHLYEGGLTDCERSARSRSERLIVDRATARAATVPALRVDSTVYSWEPLVTRDTTRE